MNFISNVCHEEILGERSLLVFSGRQCSKGLSHYQLSPSTIVFLAKQCQKRGFDDVTPPYWCPVSERVKAKKIEDEEEYKGELRERFAIAPISPPE